MTDQSQNSEAQENSGGLIVNQCKDFPWARGINMPLKAAYLFDQFARRGRPSLSMLNCDDRIRWKAFLQELGAARRQVGQESIERVLLTVYHFFPEDARRIADAYAIGATPE